MSKIPAAEKTREFIIQKSAQIFNIKGYENASLLDIQEGSKLIKQAISVIFQT
ncbi:MAG: hypothetical protein LBJ04_18030 [Sphingobacterium sp.]|jgi:AcrR family transcriptional regulator|nr:hypothetical protein [Sphingobacterium sp.]